MDSQIWNQANSWTLALIHVSICVMQSCHLQGRLKQLWKKCSVQFPQLRAGATEMYLLNGIDRMCIKCHKNLPGAPQILPVNHFKSHKFKLFSRNHCPVALIVYNMMKADVGIKFCLENRRRFDTFLEQMNVGVCRQTYFVKWKWGHFWSRLWHEVFAT